MASTQPRSAPRSPPVPNTFSSSPPLSKQQTQSYHPMSPEAFANPATNSSHFYSNSQTRYPIDRTSPSYQSNQDVDGTSFPADGQPNSHPTVLIRNLPSSMSPEALSSMFLFADDCIDARFAIQSNPDESGFQTALARFGSMESAQEVRKKLNGRMNSTQDAYMVVELLHPQTGFEAFNEPPRKTSSGGSSTGSGNRQSSRFNSAFKNMDKRSPPSLPQGLSSNSDNSNPESVSQMHHFFSPQSPGASSFADRPRVSGKSVINDDADDETGELLRDPVAYARSGHMAIPQRQQSNPSLPVSRLANLSLNTNNSGSMSPGGGTYGNARNLPPLHSPAGEMSPSGPGSGMPTSPTSGLPMSPQQFQRHHYPPANPADQNPPCNTLYVGNLPIDTSEDELKALFSKQRGYKRLCFRTKHNGPMCFVEFEDVSFATKALNELYGHPLHNSVKGGIRLSFSKNPLGVRTGQTNSMGGPQSPLSPNGAPGMGLGASPGFSTANGPPPGLVAPPGLSPPLSMNAMNTTKLPPSSFYGQNSPPIMGSTLQGRGSFSGNYSNGAPNSAGPIGSNFTGSIPGR